MESYFIPNLSRHPGLSIAILVLCSNGLMWLYIRIKQSTVRDDLSGLERTHIPCKYSASSVQHMKLYIYAVLVVSVSVCHVINLCFKF